MPLNSILLTSSIPLKLTFDQYDLNVFSQIIFKKSNIFKNSKHELSNAIFKNNKILLAKVLSFLYIFFF